MLGSGSGNRAGARPHRVRPSRASFAAPYTPPRAVPVRHDVTGGAGRTAGECFQKQHPQLPAGRVLAAAPPALDRLRSPGATTLSALQLSSAHMEQGNGGEAFLNRSRPEHGSPARPPPRRQRSPASGGEGRGTPRQRDAPEEAAPTSLTRPAASVAVSAQPVVSATATTAAQPAADATIQDSWLCVEMQCRSAPHVHFIC